MVTLPPGSARAQVGFDEFEITGLRLLAGGDPRAVLAHVGASSRTDLVAQLLVADANVRLFDGDPATLQALVARVHQEEPAGTRLLPWARAVLAEQLFYDFDVAGLLVARQGLDELAEQRVGFLPPLALRYARARLARVTSASWLFFPAPEGLATHIQLRDQSMSDLLACGFIAELHAMRGLAAGLLANLMLEDIKENHELLVDARSSLGEEPASMWTAFLDICLAVSCFEVGDMVGSIEAYDRLEQSPFQHRRITVIPRYGRAFFRLVTAGASPLTVEGIERALADVRRYDPWIAQHWYEHVTHTLADLGSRAAAHFARLAGGMPAVDAMSRADRRILKMRVDALAGERVTTDSVLTTLESIAGFGRVRKAARAAVRLGHDLASGGDPVSARLVHEWGLARLPAPERCTVWERWWARDIGDTRLPAPRLALGAGRSVPASTFVRGRRRAPSGLSVRVLAPTVEVEVETRRVTLSDAQAKLLLALVVSHPAPLHVERASDVLWPDDTLSVTRARLNSLVHRLRRMVHPYGDAITRSGALLQLVEDRCHVDLWWFQQALAGDAEDRRKALLSVRGNLGDAQFPYDEGFFDERHRVTGEWVRQACRANRSGEVALSELEPALTSLKLTPADLHDAF